MKFKKPVIVSSVALLAFSSLSASAFASEPYRGVSEKSHIYVAQKQNASVNESSVEPANAVTIAVKKAIRWALANKSKIIAEIRDQLGDKIANKVDDLFEGPIGKALNKLLEWEDLAYQAIEDQITAALTPSLGYATAKIIGFGVRKAIEWLAPV